MSRYSLKPLPEHADLFEVALGWDAGFGTYFLTLFGAPDQDRETDIRLWRGTRPREIATAAALIALATPYAELPDDLARRLEIDRLARPINPDRPASGLLQQLLARPFGPSS
ncbi:hypothetical protein OOT33_17130 [Sphingobium sp. DEHP117]|uniref:hypothetical protein n=1 Tax=Sphingobium sp. DEHP117 TaxID=2993436 RepID=UPI0027D583A6|nr:hypothetical protein [Sphingobium sp. DEHP117]MDQ4422137.1 hypothetical protein [Sphingobium sp. DEHP117]